MMTRSIALAVLGTLLAGIPSAEADRRTNPKTKRRVVDVAEVPDDQIDQDGPEATSVLPIKLDDLIEIAVRQSPELARSKNDRLAAKGQAAAAAPIAYFGSAQRPQ